MTLTALEALATKRDARLIRNVLRPGWIVINPLTGTTLAYGRTPHSALRRFLAERIATNAEAHDPFNPTRRP